MYQFAEAEMLVTDINGESRKLDLGADWCREMWREICEVREKEITFIYYFYPLSVFFF